MIYFLIFFILFLFLVIALFAFPQLSPIPYYPTNKKDLPLILKALNLKNNQVIFDLGAGDGRVIFEAAKKTHQQNLSARFIAVEINPVLILILYLRCFFHPNRKNIKIIRDDIFKMDFSSLITDNQYLITFYLYISPWYLEKVIENCKLKIKNFNVVSYMYSVKSLEKVGQRPIDLWSKKIIQGKNKIFCYN